MDTRDSGIRKRSPGGIPGDVRKEEGLRKAGTIRLMICFGILFFSVAFKFLFPGQAVKLKNEILPVLEMSVDYKAAFTSMGKFFAGEAEFGKAFGDMIAFLMTGEDAVKVGSGESVPPSEQTPIGLSQAALEKLSELRVEEFRSEQSDAAPTEVAAEIPADKPAEEPSVADFLESQSAFVGYEIPDDVNVEKIELPFDYTVPVIGAVSSGFGYRVHPIDGVTKFHYGLDYDAEVGDDIYAFADGEVYVSGESEALGLYLIVSHGDGFITQYFHCDDLLVHGGEAVTKGMKIAQVGETGKATGPHLHFEILYNGFYLNPEYYLLYEG